MKIFLLAFYFVIVDGLAVLGLWWTGVSLHRGAYPTVVVTISFALALFCISASLARVVFRRVTPRVELVDGETVIRPDRVADGLVTMGTVCVFVALAAFVMLYLRGSLAIPLPPNHTYVLVAAMIGAVAGLPNLWRIFTRGGSSVQRLDTEGFELAQGTVSVRGRWSDVADFADRRKGKSKPIRATLYAHFHDGRVRTQVIDNYSPGGESIYRFIRFYWVNDDRRDELADGRAVTRLAQFQGESFKA